MKILIILSFFASVGFVLVSYQNCSQTSNTELGSGLNASGIASCDLKSFGSNQEIKNVFTVGEIANFGLSSDPGGLPATYVLQSDAGITQNNSVTTPYFIQASNAELGNYTLTMTVTGKTTCTKSVSYSVEPSGSISCQLSATSGTSFLTGQSVPLQISSSPATLKAFLTGGSASRLDVGTTNASFTQTFPTAGTYSVYAEVLAPNGVYVRCAPQVALTIATNPNPSPSPVPTPGVSPTPTPTPPPPKPAGSIVGTPQFQTYGVPTVVSWTSQNTKYTQTFYQVADLATSLPTGPFVFVKCSAVAADSVSIDLSDGVADRDLFSLFAAPNCTPLTAAQLAGRVPLSQYLLGWRGDHSGGCCK